MMYKVLIIFLLAFVVSCNQQPVGQFDEEEPQINNPAVSNNTPIAVIRTLSWREGSIYSKTLTRSATTNKISYLFGDDLFNYFLIQENFDAKYCMSVNFASANPLAKEYRVKLTPSFLIDYTSGKKEFFLRVATSSESGNSFCNKSIETTLNDGSTILTPPHLLYPTRLLTFVPVAQEI